jgi:hypothetical protein
MLAASRILTRPVARAFGQVRTFGGRWGKSTVSLDVSDSSFRTIGKIRLLEIPFPL